MASVKLKTKCERVLNSAFSVIVFHTVITDMSANALLVSVTIHLPFGEQTLSSGDVEKIEVGVVDGVW